MNSERETYITIVPDSFVQMSSGQITGVIYFQFGEKAFPAPEWNDFVVVMLCWWLEAVVQVVDGIKEMAELWFMDGPFYVRIFTKGREGWYLECIHSRKNNEVVEYSTLVEPMNMLKSLLSVADETINQCQKNEWTLSDLDLLIARSNQMRSHLMKLS